MSCVLIAIQARSGSTRLPRKAFELISGKMLLNRVIDACKRGSAIIRQSTRGSLVARIVVLTPEGDPIAREFRGRCEIVEGPEHDVLTRYRIATDVYDPQHVMRVTGDCPLLPPFVVARLAVLASTHGYDYISNVDPLFRTALDGADCEVMSPRLVDWLDETATEASDREHVTTLARSAPPDWAKMGCVVHHFDHSDQKLSVDTRADLERVRAHFDQAEAKYQRAVLKFGQQAVHRI